MACVIVARRSVLAVLADSKVPRTLLEAVGGEPRVLLVLVHWSRETCTGILPPTILIFRGLFTHRLDSCLSDGPP